MNTIMGVIVEIGETKFFKSRFRTRHVVIDIGSSSKPNPIKIDCRDYDIDYLDSCNVNEMLEVLYELQGRKWEEKYFINVVAQNIRKLGEETIKQPIEEEMLRGNSLEEQDEWNRRFNNKDDFPF